MLFIYAVLCFKYALKIFFNFFSEKKSIYDANVCGKKKNQDILLIV